jgi:hypothetical protein
VTVLQFIDSLTGRLAWPIAAVILALVFRRPITELIGRLPRLTWGDKEAELAEVAEAKEQVQEAVEQAAKPTPEGYLPIDRDQLRRILQSTVQLGFKTGRTSATAPPRLSVEWNENEPLVILTLPEVGRLHGDGRPIEKG